MYAMLNGQPIFGPRGPAGPDGNPIGTIISYMGLSAPTDYLICDGSVYNVSDYPKLAEFFKTQFGSENYFGGDGTTTFAVPDMRNLFLRGFHGASEEHLSGEVGVKQEGTQHPYIMPYTSEGDAGIRYSAAFFGNAENLIGKAPDFSDTANSPPQRSCVLIGGSSLVSVPAYATSRPVNMAVLYCIKATVAETYEDIYSTEETRIGAWIDGKPLYKKVWYFPTFSFAHGENKITDAPANIDIIIKCGGSFDGGNLGAAWSACYVNQDKTSVMGWEADVAEGNNLIVELIYTKTTDQGANT